MLKRIILLSVFTSIFSFFSGINTVFADIPPRTCCSEENTGNQSISTGDNCYIASSGGVEVGVCRVPYDLSEFASCDTSYGGSGFICDDGCCETDSDCTQRSGYTVSCGGHAFNCDAGKQCVYTAIPGTYSCSCSGRDPVGQYDCAVLANNCNAGFKPSCNSCAPNLYNCACTDGSGNCSTLPCSLTCVPGNTGVAGDPCQCPNDCTDGFVCNESGFCQTEGAFFNCCNPANGNADCPDKAGYSKSCNIQTNSCTSGYQCSWSLLTPTPTSSVLPTTVYQQCGDFCDNPARSFGNCLKFSPNQSICERPTDEDGSGLDDDGSLDCNINSVVYDCWCCDRDLSAVTPSVTPPPVAQCTGIFGNPGGCYWFNCPVGTNFEGFNPPNNNMGCGLLRACCTNPGDSRVERKTLSLECDIPGGGKGIGTAVGCINVTNPTSFFSFILPWAIGVGSGVSFILMIVAGFIIMTASGDPQKARAGKELLTSAIAGLLMIIFSVYILNVIGVQILKLPGLN